MAMLQKYTFFVSPVLKTYCDKHKASGIKKETPISCQDGYGTKMIQIIFEVKYACAIYYCVYASLNHFLKVQAVNDIVKYFSHE